MPLTELAIPCVLLFGHLHDLKKTFFTLSRLSSWQINACMSGEGLSCMLSHNLDQSVYRAGNGSSAVGCNLIKNNHGLNI